MTSALLLSIIILSLLLSLVIWLWRQSLTQARSREDGLNAKLLEQQAQALLGEQASRQIQEALSSKTKAEGESRAAQIQAAEAANSVRLLTQAKEEFEQRASQEKAESTRLSDELRKEKDQLASDLAACREIAGQVKDLQASTKATLAERDAAIQAKGEAESARAKSQAEAQAAQAEKSRLDQELTDHKKQLRESQEKLGEANNQIERLKGEIVRIQDLVTERERQFAETQARLPEQMRAMAQQLYDEQGKTLLGEGRQQVEQTLTPFKDRLLELQTRINEVHSKDLQDRASLQQNLKDLLSAQVRLSSDADKLSRALRADTKAQGAWGELTLHRLLEASQLERGVTYELQVAVRSDEDVAGRPDAVVFLPESKAIVIDAKVSLSAFIRAVNAVDESERQQALGEHLASLRKHISGLSERHYPEAVKESLKGRTLDMTLLFLPSEAAFSAALSLDGELWAEAFKKRILVVSPTTLLATLRVVAQIWRVESQNRNTDQIVKEAEALVKKLNAAVDDFDGIGKALAKAQSEYDDARSKLFTGNGNVIRRASNMMKLGVRGDEALKKRIEEADGSGPES